MVTQVHPTNHRVMWSQYDSVISKFYKRCFLLLLFLSELRRYTSVFFRMPYLATQSQMGAILTGKEQAWRKYE